MLKYVFGCFRTSIRECGRRRAGLTINRACKGNNYLQYNKISRPFSLCCRSCFVCFRVGGGENFCQNVFSEGVFGLKSAYNLSKTGIVGLQCLQKDFFERLAALQCLQKSFLWALQPYNASKKDFGNALQPCNVSKKVFGNTLQPYNASKKVFGNALQPCNAFRMFFMPSLRTKNIRSRLGISISDADNAANAPILVKFTGSP